MTTPLAVRYGSNWPFARDASSQREAVVALLEDQLAGQAEAAQAIATSNLEAAWIIENAIGEMTSKVVEAVQLAKREVVKALDSLGDRLCSSLASISTEPVGC